ncbi:uncharacterized protein V6R79_002143 [Siganus canaliculatus]
MEQPPGSLDNLQPEDLSTSSISTVIDLTKKGEECSLNATSFDALRMVKNPSWYPNSTTGNPGLSFSETGSSDVTLQSGDRIQPDDAFSPTTVTLSYVSRSHVYSPHNSLSRHKPLCGVPPMNKLSLHPSHYSDKGLCETSYALHQHDLEQVDGPVDLAAQAKLCEAQVGPVSHREAFEVNGGVISSDGDETSPVQAQGELGLSRENCRDNLENGQGDSQSSSGACVESSSETSSDVIFLTSKKGDPAVVPDSVGAKDLRSLSREYVSPLEDPISPSATSQDDVDDVFVLPQASSSPSGDNSFQETPDNNAACNGSNTEEPTQLGLNKQPGHQHNAASEPLIDLTDDACLVDVLEDASQTVIPHMNGNVTALQRTRIEKKLPVRSSRGVRLESIVMNINSSKYQVSGCIRNSKKDEASQFSTSDLEKRMSRAKAAFSTKTIKEKAASAVKKGKTSSINTDSCKDTTSDTDVNNSRNSHRSTPPQSPRFATHKNTRMEPEQLSPTDQPTDSHAVTSPPRTTPSPSKSPKTSQGKARGKAASSKTPPAIKTKGTPKSRRKKHKPRQSSSSMFSPKEPEIKLRYVNYKEEKRDARLDSSFSPFVRVERQKSLLSLCTVINYPEEVRVQPKKGQQAPPGGYVSAVIPTTSCLQLGRPTMHSQHQRSLVCCLCGHAANTMDLGDLHGPYYPEGYQTASTKTPANTSGLKEEENGYSDSDSSSSCSVRDRGRKKAVPRAPRQLGPGDKLKAKGPPESQWWSSESPAAKRARPDGGSTHVDDWYSPPVLPLEPCEYWLHEDCGIWSAGVFLVKGKIYGLEEAVKVAQETTCSACRNPGATLGCFFKSCPNKYHFRCALESDCVLIEENFSMKCKKHKSKTFKAPPGSRWDDR